jgi:hypothetical protein
MSFLKWIKFINNKISLLDILKIKIIYNKKMDNKIKQIKYKVIHLWVIKKINKIKKMKTKIKILFNQLKLPEMLIIIAILKIITLIIHLLVILFKIYNYNSKFINKIYNNNKLTRYNNKAPEPKIKYPLLNKLNKKLLLNKINNLSSTKIILIILHLVTLLINKIHFIKILIISNSKIK